MPMGFHILGLGSIGSLIAFHLRSSLPKTPITLIVKGAQSFPLQRRAKQGLPIPPLGPDSPERDYATQGQAQVGVERDGRQKVVGGFDVEIWRDKVDRRREKDLTPRISFSSTTTEPAEPIRSIIVTLKTPTTLQALSSLKSRISPTSVITLLQNGMGVYDELCSKLWPDPSTRPHFILGTTTHGVSPTNEMGRVLHQSKAGEGEIKWGVVPDPRKVHNLEKWIWGSDVGTLPILSPLSSPPLPLRDAPDDSLEPLRETLQALLSLHNLSSSLLPMPHLHHQLLLKLALNSIINPLTAVLGSGLPNGILSRSVVAAKLIEMLAAETSSILTAYIHQLAAPHSVPLDVVRLFSEESLRYRTIGLVQATSTNVSSMAGDVVKGRMTEVDYINGYLISLGQRLGIEAPNHRMIRQMVKFKAELNGLQPGIVSDKMKQTSQKVEGRGWLREKSLSQKAAKRQMYEAKKETDAGSP